MGQDELKRDDAERVEGKNPSAKKRDELNRIVGLVNEGEGGISSIKRVTLGILGIINDPESTARDLQKLIEIDPSLCLKVLKMANSAYYAPKKRVSNIGQAIINIGFNNVKELALSQKVCEIFSKKEHIGEYSRPSLWKHSLSIAILGQMIYRKEFGAKGQEVYAAGLLHDVGIIVEDQFLHDDFRLILKRALYAEENLSQAERSVLGFTHADIGRALAADWNFPTGLRTAMGFHHMPSKVKPSLTRVASTLFIAEYLAAENGIGFADAPFISSSAFQKHVKKLGLTVQGLDLIVEDMKQELSEMEKQGLFET